MAFGKSGWTPVGVFLVHYLFYSLYVVEIIIKHAQHASAPSPARSSLAAVNFTQVFTSATNFLPTASLGWMIENGFIERSDLWAAVTNPAVAKRITKEFCTWISEHLPMWTLRSRAFATTVKRLKQFAAEEKERRRLGLSDEAAFERFAVVRHTATRCAYHIHA